MVKTKNGIIKIVAMMLILTLMVGIFAVMMPKQATEVEAATLDREPGLYQAGTTTQTHTWEECTNLFTMTSYRGEYLVGISKTNETEFDGDLVLGDFSVGQFKDYEYLRLDEESFSNCTKLVCIDISKASFSNISSMSCAFNNIKSLKTFNCGKTSIKDTNINTAEMFKGCSNLTTVTGSLDFTGIKETLYISDSGLLVNMFKDCSNLVNIDLPSFLLNTTGMATTYGMFQGCLSLKSIKIGTNMFTGVAAMNYMFKDCINLESVAFETNSIHWQNGNENMFDGCSGLKRIKLAKDFGAGVDSSNPDTDYEFFTMPTAPDNTHFALTSEPSKAITRVNSDMAGKTIELYGADNKSLAPADTSSIDPDVPSTGVVSNSAIAVIALVSVIALVIFVTKKTKSI